MPTKNIDKALLDKLAKEAGKEMKKEEVWEQLKLM